MEEPVTVNDIRRFSGIELGDVNGYRSSRDGDRGRVEHAGARNRDVPCQGRIRDLRSCPARRYRERYASRNERIRRCVLDRPSSERARRHIVRRSDDCGAGPFARKSI